MQNNDNNLIINNSQRTTVKISNIKKSLTSELIYLILEKNFPRAYNAIYTKRKEGHIKNSGVCYINFAEEYYIYRLSEILYEFKRKKKDIKLEYAEFQGNEFIKKISQERQKRLSLDFIVFSYF